MVRQVEVVQQMHYVQGVIEFCHNELRSQDSVQSVGSSLSVLRREYVALINSSRAALPSGLR